MSEESVNGAVITQGQLHPHSRHHLTSQLPLQYRPGGTSARSQPVMVLGQSEVTHLSVANTSSAPRLLGS